MNLKFIILGCGSSLGVPRIDGNYGDCDPKNPKNFRDAKLIRNISNIKKDLKNVDIKGRTEFGSGGMDTKIEAARICNLAGCNMVIANGLYLNPINQIEKKKNSTWFIS